MTDMTLDIQQIFGYSLNHAEFFVTFLSIVQSTHPHAFTSLGPLFFSIVSSYFFGCVLCLNGTYHSFSMGKMYSFWDFFFFTFCLLFFGKWLIMAQINADCFGYLGILRHTTIYWDFIYVSLWKYHQNHTEKCCISLELVGSPIYFDM